MKKVILVCLTAICFAACGSEETTQTSNKSVEASSEGIINLTKNKQNIPSIQDDDAWFVHRILSVFEKKKFGRTDCYAKGEFENKGNAPLYIAQVKYRTVLIENPPKGTPDNQETIVQVAPEFGKPNLNPLLPGETRPADMGPLYFPCDVFKGMKLVGFIAKGINPDGTVKHRAVKDGISALVIDNQTNFKVTR